MTSETTWKEKIVTARKLRGKTAAIVYDRIVLLDAVFDDADFRNENDFDDIQAVEHLDAEIGDLAADFLTLRRVLKLSPNKKEWAGRDLRRMIAETLEADRESSKSEGPVKTYRRATLAELDKALEEKELAETRLVIVERRNRELEENNRLLREEVAGLQGRIHELERIVNRDLAAA